MGETGDLTSETYAAVSAFGELYMGMASDLGGMPAEPSSKLGRRAPALFPRR